VTLSEPPGSTRPGPPTPADLDALFSERVNETANAVLAARESTVLFDLGMSGRWTLHISGGTLRVDRGAPITPPTTTIRVDPTTFAAVLEGDESGAAAFLDGRLTIRGDLSLGLSLDGAFTGERPFDHPRAGIVTPLGVRTSYFEVGDPSAPPVIALHGLGATNASLLPIALRLAATHRVVVPDLPGHGETAAPRWAYRARDFAVWLGAFMRAVGVRDRATILGNSLGGRIAIEAGLVMPERVDRLVMLCPSPALRRFRQFVPVARVLSPDLARVFPLIATHRAVVRGIKAMFARPERLPQSWYDAGADEYLRVMRRPAHRRAFWATLRQIYVEEPFGTRGFWDRLNRVTAPALFVWGERDLLVPAAFARHVTAALPNAQSVVLRDCGHVPQFELPDRTHELVLEFLT
jgi:pimeloyl-ACP methyl ester carboxylesterase/putative sterol carrier protein